MLRPFLVVTVMMNCFITCSEKLFFSDKVKQTHFAPSLSAQSHVTGNSEHCRARSDCGGKDSRFLETNPLTICLSHREYHIILMSSDLWDLLADLKDFWKQQRHSLPLIFFSGKLVQFLMDKVILRTYNCELSFEIIFSAYLIISSILENLNLNQRVPNKLAIFVFQLDSLQAHSSLFSLDITA